jgi:hypothetical protein
VAVQYFSLLALMTENPLPSSLYEGLLEKLVIVLELSQKKEGVVTPPAKQAILQAVRLSVYALRPSTESLFFALDQRF